MKLLAGPQGCHDLIATICSIMLWSRFKRLFAVLAIAILLLPLVSASGLTGFASTASPHEAVTVTAKMCRACDKADVSRMSCSNSSCVGVVVLPFVFSAVEPEHRQFLLEAAAELSSVVTRPDIRPA